MEHLKDICEKKLQAASMLEEVWAVVYLFIKLSSCDDLMSTSDDSPCKLLLLELDWITVIILQKKTHPKLVSW